MPGAHYDLRRSEVGAMELHVSGRWHLQSDVPSASEVAREIGSQSGLERLRLAADGLTAWDSSLVDFLYKVVRGCARLGVHVDDRDLPEGVRGLLALARAVPERRDAEHETTEPSFLADVGNETIAFYRSSREIVAFIGAIVADGWRVIRGQGRFRGRDLWLTVQQVGAQALPIVSLISFLVGVILAFVGAVQLREFGAQIYVADLVGLGMVRDMGAMMTGIIMAGRTGAAFAAELGTMTVNEEIDALRTMGISPMEFLVIPRILALLLMMPMLCLYSDFMGILGGAAVGVTLFDLGALEYAQETRDAVDLVDFAGGVVKGTVYGAIVAIAGCLRGMQCARSSAAVGAAATSAVVTGIVFIVIACAVLTVVYDILGV